MVKSLHMSKIKLVAALILPAFVLAPVSVLAAAVPENKPAVETRAQRVEKNKTKFSVKLTDADSTKIKGKCKAAQVISKAHTSQVNKKEVSRKAVYGEITKAVEDAIAEFKTAGKDTATLESQSKELTDLIGKYNTSLTTFKTSLTDLSEVECVTDPAAFKASLESSRDARKTVAEDAKAIRKFVNDTIKKTLKETEAKKSDKPTETDTDAEQGSELNTDTGTDTAPATGGNQ